MSTVSTINDLTQPLQQHLATHQAIYQREPDKSYVMDDTATISAYEPVKVNVSFVSEGEVTQTSGELFFSAIS